MKRLVLMRHAKAEHYSTEGDKGRELAPRGRQDAGEAGLALKDLGIQRALVSTSTRTRQTFSCLGIDAEPDYVDWLYYGGSDTLREHLAELPEGVSSVIVVGHAPTIPGLAAELSASGSDLGWFPTARFVEFTFDGPWAQLGDYDHTIDRVPDPNFER